MTAAVKKATTLIDELDMLWPALLPPAELSTDASALHGAAARVELMALGM